MYSLISTRFFLFQRPICIEWYSSRVTFLSSFFPAKKIWLFEGHVVNKWYPLDHCAKSATPARRHITRWIEIGYYISRSLFQFSHAKTDDQKTRGQYLASVHFWKISEKFGQFWSIFEIGWIRKLARTLDSLKTRTKGISLHDRKKL